MIIANITFPSALGWMLLGWVLLLALFPQQTSKAKTKADWVWWCSIGAMLLSFRWSTATLAHALYPDESQMIAGAITLAHDPLFWRSVDGGTAGPLDFYPLLPSALAHGTASYIITRIIAAGVIWGTLIAIGKTLSLFFPLTVSRLAVLPYLIFESLITSAEFTHYSTELMPTLMLACAVFFIARQGERPATRNVWIGATLLGAVPFSKLQAAPIALTLAVLLCVQEIFERRKSNLTKILVGLSGPAIAVGLVVTLTGQVENFIIPYFLQNSVYVAAGELTLREITQLQWMQSMRTGYLICWFGGSVVFFSMAAAFVIFPSPRIRRLGLTALIFLAAAVACIYFPRRPYHHYLTLAFGPLTLLTGICLGCLVTPACWRPGSKYFMQFGLFVLCVVASQLAYRAFRPIDLFAAHNTLKPTAASRQLTDTILSYADPGEALGIWGWRSDLYVETGLHQATRQAHSEAQLVGGKWGSYFLRIYFEDLQRSAPPVFVDTVGPGNFRFVDRSLAHECFPVLQLWLTIHYNLVTDLDGARVYVRNDRLIKRRTRMTDEGNP